MYAIRSYYALKSTLSKSEPTDYHYAALKEKLITYLTLQETGGWSPILLNKSLRPGETDESVSAIRERLAITGDDEGCEETNVYNTCLQEAIKRFQMRHGLSPDGA